MKKIERITVWENKFYQEKVKKDLETALLQMQRLLNEWTKLDVGLLPDDIIELLVAPQQCYRIAVDKMVPLTVSNERFSVKRDQYLQTLNLPDPSELYKTAEQTMKVSYCNIPGLFEIDGRSVKLNEAIARFYYTMSDVTVSEPHQIALAADLKAWLELTNSLNERLDHKLYYSESPVANRFFFGICSFEGGDGRGANGTLNFLPEFLREVLQ